MKSMIFGALAFAFFAPLLSAVASEDFPMHSLVLFDADTNRKLTIETAIHGEVTKLAVTEVAPNLQPDRLLSRAEISNQRAIWAVEAISRQNRYPFRGFRAELGRSGEITVMARNAGTCLVASTFREFLIAQDKIVRCSYFYAVGTRPVISGSN